MHRVKNPAQRSVWALTLAVSFLVLVSMPLTSRAADSSADGRVDASVELSEDLSRLVGEVTVEVVNHSGGPMKEVALWVFPTRLNAPPEDMDDVVLPRAFPNGFDPGDLNLKSVRVPGGEPLRTRAPWPGLVWVQLAQPVPSGAPLTLEVHYEVRVPERYGPFGRVGKQLTLDGGFIPRPTPQSSEGFLERSPPGLIDYSLKLRWAGQGRLEAYVNGEQISLSSEPQRVTGRRAERVSLVAAPSFKRMDFGAKPNRVRFAHRRARAAVSGPDDLTDLAVIDPASHAVATTVDVLRFVQGQLRRPGGPLLVVEAPLRRDIAISAPGMLLLSDRAFELTPLERFLRVHRVALARAVAESRLRAASLDVERGRRDRVRDLLAIHLSERWEQARYGGQVGIREILGPGRFIAAVEDVIRSPQIPFQSTWFRVVDDTDPFRDRFSLFAHSHPNGRLWREKLLDKLGVEALDSVVDKVARGQSSLMEALRDVAPDLDARAYLEQWETGTPEVNYRLLDVREVSGGLEVAVAREGTTTLEEPVTIAAIGAKRNTAVWDGAGERVSLHIEGAQLGDEIVVDPSFRLVESDLGEAVNARYDNKSIHRWRPLLRGFGFDVNSATGRVNTAIAGSLIRSNDIRYSVALRAYDRERTAGAQALLWRGFGPKVRASQRRFSLGTGLGVSWLKPEENAKDGLGMVLSLSLTDSTTVSSTSPRSGHLYSVSAGPVFATGADESTFGAFGILGARGLTPLGRSHVLAGRIQVGVHWGEVLDAQQWPAGGVNGVRAIDPYAARGRHRIFGSLEWRHRLFNDMSVSFLNLSWIEWLDGVLFADVASVTDNMNDLAEERGIFGGLGYGLRVHHRIAGFKPMVLSIDYGVPVLDRGQFAAPSNLAGSLVVAVGQVF